MATSRRWSATLRGAVRGRRHRAPARSAFARAGDLRYVGQGYELRVPIPDGRDRRRRARGRVWRRSTRCTKPNTATCSRTSPIEIVNIRVTGIGQMPKIGRLKRRRTAARSTRRWSSRGRCVFRVDGRLRSVRRPRSTSASCCRWATHSQGPAIILQTDSTTVVPPGCRGRRRCARQSHHHRWERSRMNQLARRPAARPQRRRDRIDPVTASVIQGALENIAIEMGHKLMRMSYSSIIRESEDFGAALIDAAGPPAVRVQAEHAAAVRPDPRLHPRHPAPARRRAARRSSPAT